MHLAFRFTESDGVHYLTYSSWPLYPGSGSAVSIFQIRKLRHKLVQDHTLGTQESDLHTNLTLSPTIYSQAPQGEDVSELCDLDLCGLALGPGPSKDQDTLDLGGVPETCVERQQLPPYRANTQK